MAPSWQAPKQNESSRSRRSVDPAILKVGLATIRDGRILLVRKQGGPSFILPGGKPQNGETDTQTLHREIAEELSCEVVGDSLRWVGEFEDNAADLPGQRVKVRLYSGELRGEVSSASEIIEVRWWDQTHDDPQLLAPSLRHKILQALQDDLTVGSQHSGRPQSDRT
jgi:8-oxo-dGTP diphosphatase